MTLGRSLQILAAIAVLALLWSRLDGPQALRLLAEARPEWLAAALVALTAQTILSAVRWRWTARLLGQRIPLRHAVSEYYLGQVVNQSLPGGVLGDAGRAVRTRHEAGLRRAGAAVAIERLAGQIALLLVLGAALLCVALVPGGMTVPIPLQVLVAFIPVGCLLAALAVRFSAALPGRLGELAQDLRLAVAQALFTRRAFPRQAALNLAITGSNLAAFAFCARATGTSLSPVEVAVLVPLILLTMIVPVTISGWGLREGAAAGLFPIVGASASAGMAASLAFGLVFLASTAPGLLVLLTRRTGRAAGADT